MDASQILPNLFVGSFRRTAEDIDLLKREYGITAVLNLQSDDDLAWLGLDWGRLEARYRELGIEVRRVPIRDFDRQDLRRQLPRCVAALDELIQRGCIVFMHCNMGINRSPSAAIAYLWWIQHWSLDKSVDHVMKCRSCEPYVDVIRLAGEDRAKQ